MINPEKKWISIVHSWNSQNPHRHYLQKCKDRFVCIAPCQVTRKSSRMKMKGTQGLCKKKNSPFSGSDKRKKFYVQMVSAHSMVLFSKAIEMFILELTLRAWMQADQVKRQTLKRYDFARAIREEKLFDFLSDIIPLQTHKNQFQVEEANDGQGNEFDTAHQMIQPNNIPYQFQVEAANDVQGNKFHLANQMVQPHNIPLQQLYQFQVGGEANDGQGNGFDPTFQIVQPNNIPVQAEANDGQGNEFHPTYQMGQPNNIPNQFQVEEDTNGGQGNEFHPSYQMAHPNDIPASFISIQGKPVPLMLPPLINLSPEAEFNIDEFLVDNEEDLESTELN